MQLELKYLYAQLNPHFIFNALSSIQGLVNKHDTEGANIYLLDFASLMRESLNASNKDHVPINKELLIIDAYLKLEQLRFGFFYKISVDENINIFESEIPSLLLQPVIENAVKHGISALQEKGEISINFKQHQNDMYVTINDNGQGFKANTNAAGFGLKLTRDRLKLWNELFKEQQILLEIKNNNPSGTMIYITFKNWFL